MYLVAKPLILSFFFLLASQLLKEVLSNMRELPIGQVMLIPGGWVGLTTTGSLLYILERVSDEEFALVVCNGGGEFYFRVIAGT